MSLLSRLSRAGRAILGGPRGRPGGPRQGPAILMYHRVAAPRFDPWDLAVSPDRFEAQLAWLAASRTVLPMDAFVAGLKAGTLPADAAAITFDDGYRDNLLVAAPLLARHGLPATLFVPTGFVGTAAPFWWDELADLILGAPVGVVPALGGQPAIPLGRPEAGDETAWRASREAGTRRQRAFLDVWARLRAMTPDERTEAMASVRAALPRAPADASAHPMTAEELAALVDEGWFTIGAHSVSHPAMSRLGDAEVRAELLESIRRCESLTGRPVSGFAFPYGDLSPAALAIVAQSGLTWACSTVPAVARARDVFALPRLQVVDQPPEDLARRLAEVAAGGSA